MATTSTTIEEFIPKIRNGKLILETEKRSFTCGSFMARMEIKDNSYFKSIEHKLNKIIVKFVRSKDYSKYVEFWTEKVKDLGLEVDYMGYENDSFLILYTLPNMESGTTRLLRFTILRYLWATPYDTLVQKMYNLVKNKDEIFNKYTFWEVFMLYHPFLQKINGYSSTFGLFSEDTYGFLDNKTFKSLFVIKENTKYDSINNRFAENSKILKKRKPFIPLGLSSKIKLEDYYEKL